MLVVGIEQDIFSRFVCFLVQIIDEMCAVFHHVPGVTGIVRGSFVDCGRHHAYKGLEQVFNLFNIKNILDRNRCLGSNRFDHRDHFRREGTDSMGSNRLHDRHKFRGKGANAAVIV